MRHIALLLSVAAVAGLLPTELSDDVEAQDHDPQIWTYGVASMPVADSTKLGLETVHRYSGNQQALYEDQYIFTVQRQIAKNVTLTIGYNRVVSSRDGTVTATEHRPRQMITFPIAKFGNTATLIARVRAEQRFRSDDPKDGHRLRAEYRLDFPLSRDGYVLRYMHEDYLNLNTTRFQNGGYERMRNALSVFFPIGKTAKLELGYMNQWRFNPEPRRDLMEHGGLVGLTLAL